VQAASQTMYSGREWFVDETLQMTYLYISTAASLSVIVTNMYLDTIKLNYPPISTIINKQTKITD